MFLNKSFPNDKSGMLRAINFVYENLINNRLVYLEGKIEKYETWNSRKKTYDFKKTLSYNGTGKINVYTFENTKIDLETFELNKYKHPNIIRIYTGISDRSNPEYDHDILRVFPEFAVLTIRYKIVVRNYPKFKQE